MGRLNIPSRTIPEKIESDADAAIAIQEIRRRVVDTGSILRAVLIDQLNKILTLVK
jgi:hypothetical protein